MKTLKQGLVATGLLVGVLAGSSPARADVDFRSLLKEGLLGAGVGAISAGVGKGNAGTGALVGAGTQIIGGSLLSFLTAPSSSGSGQTAYVSQRQVYAAEPVYYAQPQPVYAQSQPVYSQPVVTTEPAYTYSQPTYTYSQPVTYAQPQTQDDSAKKIIKQGLLGAGVGALSAGVGDGNAGTGALVGAGTSVIGGALLDFLSGPSAASTPQTVYYTTPQPARSSIRTKPAAANTSVQPVQKRIVRTFDAAGNLVQEEEFWQ